MIDNLFIVSGIWTITLTTDQFNKIIHFYNTYSVERKYEFYDLLKGDDNDM